MKSRQRWPQFGPQVFFSMKRWLKFVADWFGAFHTLPSSKRAYVFSALYKGSNYTDPKSKVGPFKELERAHVSFHIYKQVLIRLKIIFIVNIILANITKWFHRCAGIPHLSLSLNSFPHTHHVIFIILITTYYQYLHYVFLKGQT